MSSKEPETSRRSFLAGSAAALGALATSFESVRAEALRAGEVAAGSSQKLRAQYLLDPSVTYLNHASIGTIPRLVVEACQQYLEICESNPWFHIWGGEWDEPREDVRRRAANYFGCDSARVALTHNTTEVFNVLAQGLPLVPSDEVLFSDLNHSGASVCFEQRSARGQYRVRRFSMPSRGLTNLQADELVDLYAEQIRPATRVVVIPHIDNVVGLRHPVAELAAMARDRGVEYVLVDGAQSVGMVPVDVASLDVDCYATSPHKWLQAPKGLGLAYFADSLIEAVAPMWVTWGQKRWAGSARVFEDYGTRNLPELLALGDAIEFQVALGRAGSEQGLRELREYARQRTEAEDGLQWRSPLTWEMGASLFAIGLDTVKASTVGKRLFDEHGIVVRSFDAEHLNTLRVSPNHLNSKADLDHFFESLALTLDQA